MKIVLNKDEELVAEIDRQLKENQDKYGKRYCPCSLEKTDATVCMCEEFRNMEEGECHCGKFIKIKGD